MTRIHIGADSTGYVSATALRTYLIGRGYEVIWHAAPAFDDGDDYPAIAIRTIQAVVSDEDEGVASRAVIVSTDGAGEVIAANKVNGARVVSATTSSYAASARRHADANGLVLPTAHVPDSQAFAIVEVFLETEFAGVYDDARRLVNVAEYESSGTIEGWMIES